MVILFSNFVTIYIYINLLISFSLNVCKQKYFDVDDSRKAWLMKEAGKLAKNFGATLTKNWVRDHNGNINWNPPPIYSGFISKEDWHTFVRMRTEDPKFLVSAKIY